MISIALLYISFINCTENGYKKVQFHVIGTLSCYTKAEIEKNRDTVAAFVGCNSTEIHVTGYYPSASFLVVLSIEDKLARKLLTVEQQEKDKLCKLNIDYFIVDFITVHLQNHISKYFFLKEFCRFMDPAIKNITLFILVSIVFFLIYTQIQLNQQ